MPAHLNSAILPKSMLYTKLQWFLVWEMETIDVFIFDIKFKMHTIFRSSIFYSYFKMMAHLFENKYTNKMKQNETKWKRTQLKKSGKWRTLKSWLNILLLAQVLVRVNKLIQIKNSWPRGPRFMKLFKIFVSNLTTIR
jgi:hypothetical protein